MKSKIATGIISFLIVLSPLEIFADQPPSWCEFSTYSVDSSFRADIFMTTQDTLKSAWQNDWAIRICNNLNDSSIWTSKFYNDGYGAGTLSKDGKIYVYGNWWLEMDYKNQFIIYKPDTIIRYSGQDFGLEESYYKHTVSHKIWMEKYYLSPDFLTDTTKLIIETLDSKKIELDLNNYKIHVSKIELSKEEIEQIEYVKKMGLWTVLVIGLGIVILAIRAINQGKNKSA